MSAADVFDLTGRTALVTGGSSGLGAAIAVALAEAGADILLHHATVYDAAGAAPDPGNATRARIEAAGRRCWPIDVDLQGPAAVRALLEGVAAADRSVDILVVNASVQANRTLEEITTEEVDREYHVNFRSTVGLLQGLVPPMAVRRWGRVLSIGSVQQARPHPINVTYAALKAAQETLMRGLATQYGGRGVLFNTLSPGIIATERNRSMWESDPEWAVRRAAANVVGRVSDPEDYVGAALLLCSEAARFITGANLYATGGAQLPLPPA